ncbi:hypothetical protein U3516DRAFT_852576 [Neocallimastix sp. 'constans']
MTRRHQNLTRNQTSNQNQILLSNPNKVTGITFSYTDNFNKIMELNTDNYPSWKTSMLHFLGLNNLIN